MLTRIYSFSYFHPFPVSLWSTHCSIFSVRTSLSIFLLALVPALYFTHPPQWPCSHPFIHSFIISHRTFTITWSVSICLSFVNAILSYPLRHCVFLSKPSARALAWHLPRSSATSLSILRFHGRALDKLALYTCHLSFFLFLSVVFVSHLLFAIAHPPLLSSFFFHLLSCAYVLHLVLFPCPILVLYPSSASAS